MKKTDGIITAVQEYREAKKLYKERPTAENRATIRFSELSIIQMAESLADKNA